MQTKVFDDEEERESTKGMTLQDRKKMALSLEKQEEEKEKGNKKKAIENEKAEEAAEGGSTESTGSADGQGSAARITKILKMLEEEITARSDKPEEPLVERPEKEESPCNDGMAELKKYFSGREGLKRSNVFLRFAKLLTGDGSDGAQESIVQAPMMVAESKPPVAAATSEEETADDDQEPINLIQKKHKALKKKINQRKKKAVAKK